MTGFKYRIRVAATDPETGKPIRYRIISGNGPKLRQHGEFNSLQEAVAFVAGAKSKEASNEKAAE